ncbi:MAG: spore maturation protein A [Oscillospiraceae bacterium]|nr:spore maturation protein A [Oscillospiraceae bacterium]
MEAAKRSGLTEKICFALLPVLGTIFPRLRKEKAALGAISMNITANMLGLGNAATPLGIAAMKELKSISAHGCTASKEMVCFVVMNTASLQILPTTVAILRMEAGANRPLDILPAVWIVSLCSLFIGICVAKFSYRGGAQK